MKPNDPQDDVIYDIQTEIETWIENPGHTSRFGALYVFVDKALSVELSSDKQKKLHSALKDIQDHLRGSNYKLLGDIVGHVKSWNEDLTRTVDSNSNISKEKKVVEALNEIQAIIREIK